MDDVTPDDVSDVAELRRESSLRKLSKVSSGKLDSGIGGKQSNSRVDAAVPTPTLIDDDDGTFFWITLVMTTVGMSSVSTS